MTTRYYQLLFAGKLGFKLAAHFEEHPHVLGFELNESGADESFSVYDHPPVWIFTRSGAGLSAHAILNQLTSGLNLTETSSRTGAQKSLLLSPTDAAGRQHFGATLWSSSRQRAWPTRFHSSGGSWSSSCWVWCHSRWHTSRLPRAARSRLGSVQAAGTAGPGLRHLAAVQPLESCRLIAGRSSPASCCWRRSAWRWPGGAAPSFWRFARERWKLVLIGEIGFLVAFLLFTWIRALDPDLWHIYRGGEKPMELAFLNAILRSRYMPPYDPWFSGGYINYYYYGQYLIAVLIKLTGIVPTTAFNLAIPLLFALTFSAAYSVVLGLTRRWWAGLAGGIALVVVCNLDGLWQTLNQVRSLLAGTTGAAVRLLAEQSCDSL